MYYVGFVESESFVKYWDCDGLVLSKDHRTAICFDNELLAWKFLLLTCDQFDYGVDDLFVQFFDFEEEN